MEQFSISLYENPATDPDGFIASVTDYFARSWRHCIAERGGCKLGEGEMHDANEFEMELFFISNLARRMIVGLGGSRYWDGLITRMELVKRGQTFVRTIERMANRVKVIYRKIGPQLLSNGDVESGAWGSVGTPSTIETTTAWFSRGTTAMHCVTDAASEGMEIESAVAISANVPYNCSVMVNVVSGTWTLQVLDNATSTVVAQRATDGTAGRTWLQCQIPENNTYTSVDIHLIAALATEECYADGAILRTAPRRSETKWYENSASMAAYGTIEGVALVGEMTDDEADGMATRELAERAWPRTEGGARGNLTTEQLQENKLTVTCQGMYQTLGWRHTLRDATAQADAHVTSVLDESEFLSSGNAIIDTNSAEVLIESGNPITLLQAIEKVVDVGDGAGASWTFGVYPDFEFRYEARSADRLYEFRDGELRHFGGATLHPVEAVPGYIWMADMPREPSPAGASDTDDPRWQLATEMWFVADGGNLRNEWVVEE